ncbi:MAG: xanthine dehydrogenase family protein subunit M [bacterium]|jgi:carbon-monoxide dehydrogenase medium subunit
MLPRFEYHRAATIEEALGLLEHNSPDARILAGGTDLLVSMKEGICSPGHVIDIKAIPDLTRIEVASDGSLVIGACATVNEILELKDLPPGMAALHDAASVLATYQLRNRATVGGNIANASPACDLGPPLLVLGAEVTAVSPSGERTVAISDFFTSVKQTCLAQDEVVTFIRVPPAAGTVSAFAKRRRIRGHDLATVNVAAALSGTGGLRLGLGAVATVPLLVDVLGGAAGRPPGDLREAAVRAALDAIAPIDDVRASAGYRCHMVELLVEKTIDMLSERMEGAK